MLITSSAAAKIKTGATSPVRAQTSSQEAPAPQDQVSTGQQPIWDPTQSIASLKEKRADGTVVMDGVRWGLNEVGAPSEWTGRFDTTEIDPSKIKDVYVGLVPFMSDKIAHAILVFEFSEPIKNAQGETDDRLVLSVDARVQKGEKWSINKGLKREYPLLYQLDSFGARVQRSNRQLGDRLILNKLDLEQDEKQKLIDTALEEATTPKPNYHTVENSCWTNVIDLLNKVTDDGQKIRKRSVLLAGLTPRAGVINPMFAGSLLESEGLLTGEPGLVIQPDSKLHGDKKVSEKGNNFIKGVSQSSWWTPGCTAAGAAAGAGLGYAIGGVIPGVIGGLVAGYVADKVSREVRVRHNVTFTNAEQFYPKQGVDMSHMPASTVLKS